MSKPKITCPSCGVAEPPRGSRLCDQCYARGRTEQIYVEDPGAMCLELSHPWAEGARVHKCSLELGHAGGHRSHKFHDPDQPPVWVGPWEDGSPYEVSW